VLDPGRAFYVALFGTMKRGAIAVPLFTLFGPEGLALRIDDCQPRLLLTAGSADDVRARALAHGAAADSPGTAVDPATREALRALGYGDEHPAVRMGIEAIESFITDHEGRLFFQPCISPTWDTALMAKALLDSGVPGDHPALVRAADWLIDRQIHEPGDWSVYNPTLTPGGWAFEFENRWYPDVDDTAVILMALGSLVALVPQRADSQP